ncbi:MAG: adenylate/guanylate cyclase domain-containing protein, partial [Myxococcales bacterium]
MAGVERRLAAILSADAVSYSRLVASDDAGTLRHMARIRAIVEEAVRECGGRVVDARGDNLLAEFSSASSAVTAAMQAQERLEAQERPLPEAERLRLRMGVHLGDVVEEDTLAGDAVNIAARIEALAEPGGVCVSDVVAGQVMRRAPYSFERLGPRRLKNIPGRVVVYRVGPPGTAPTARPRRVRRLLAAGCAAAVLAAIPIAILGRSTALQPTAVLDALAESPRAAPTTAIAVLPFANLSSDPDQEFFSDGLTEELISQLAGVAALQVAARTSSFAFKGRELDIRRIAAELGVGSVVEGSVRREGGRLRVTAQLIQADDGFHLWASSYERSAQEVFAIQEEIAQSITGTLRVLLTG